jgi:hypothetical protein
MTAVPIEVEEVEYIECEIGGEEVTEDQIADCGASIHCFDHWDRCGACVDENVLERRAEQAADRSDYLGCS